MYLMHGPSVQPQSSSSASLGKRKDPSSALPDNEDPNVRRRLDVDTPSVDQTIPESGDKDPDPLFLSSDEVESEDGECPQPGGTSAAPDLSVDAGKNASGVEESGKGKGGGIPDANEIDEDAQAKEKEKAGSKKSKKGVKERGTKGKKKKKTTKKGKGNANAGKKGRRDEDGNTADDESWESSDDADDAEDFKVKAIVGFKINQVFFLIHPHSPKPNNFGSVTSRSGS